MTEQDYKELSAAVRESGIALPLQKKIQRLLDIEKAKGDERQQSEEVTGNKVKNQYSGMYIDRSRV